MSEAEGTAPEEPGPEKSPWDLEVASGAGGLPTLRCRMAPDLDQLSLLIRRLEEFTSGTDPVQAHRVCLAVDELLTNVIQYGAVPPRWGLIRVQVTLRDHLIEVHIEHDGVPFNPFVEAPAPDINLPLEQRPIGGLGVYLVKSLMTSTEYERVGARNHITLTRSL